MDPPAVTRRRRPFLAPLWLVLLAAVVVVVLAVGVYRGAGTTMVLLVQSGTNEAGVISDPPLSPEGEERAQRLARVLSEGQRGVEVDAIYVSDDQRAAQTAALLSRRLQRAPNVFTADQAAVAAGHVLHQHAGGTVLIVASGAAFAQVLRALGVEDGAGANEPDVTYLISVPSFGRPRLVRLHL